MIEEERSKNLMVFGLSEDDEEDLEANIGELFCELGEKPRITAVSGIGKKISNTKVIRPVKVSFSNSTSAYQLLSQASRLKGIEHRKSVYLSYDRSPEERAARRKIVTDLKKWQILE